MIAPYHPGPLDAIAAKSLVISSNSFRGALLSPASAKLVVVTSNFKQRVDRGLNLVPRGTLTKNKCRIGLSIDAIKALVAC